MSKNGGMMNDEIRERLEKLERQYEELEKRVARLEAIIANDNS